MLEQVLNILTPGMSYTSSDGTYENVVFEDSTFVKPNIAAYEYILYTLTNVEALKKFREKRNVLLDQSDKYMTRDYPHLLEKDPHEWANYRRALRDLPYTARPTLDENGNLKDVEWPKSPIEALETLEALETEK